MITESFWLLLYLAAIFLPGHAVVSIICQGERRSRVERVGLIVAIGAGTLGLLLFWASLAGFKPSRSLLAFIVFVFGGIQFRLRRSRQSRAIGSPPATRSSTEWALTIASITVLAICLAVVSIHSLGLPVYEWDSFSIWAFKAKVLAREALSAQPQYFNDVSLSYSHLDYPLLVPFLMAGAYGAMGEVNEYLGKIIFPIFYAGFGFLIFRALEWKMKRLESWLLTVLAMSLPALVRWSGAGIGDVVLVLDYAGAIFYFLKWLEEERKADLVVLILFSVFAAFTKNEGLALALIVAAVMLLSCAVARTRIKWAGFFSFVGGVLLLLSPWLWWSRNLPRTHENYGAQLRPAVVIENWNRINVILADFLRQGAAWSKWGGIWLLLLLVAVFGARGFRRQNVVVLWLLLFAQLSLYVLIFVVTPWNVQELLDSALDRLLLQTLPLVVLLIGFHWSEIARAADVAVPRR